MASLADIYKSEKKQGGGLASALGKSMKESFDPRNLLDQEGLMVSMFPSLKGYEATPKKDKKDKKDSSGTSPQKASFDELLSGLGTKTTFDRLYKAQVMSMKYTSVLPEISSDLKKINKLLLGMISDSEESNGILDAVLDTLDRNRKYVKKLLDEKLPSVGYRIPDCSYLAWLDLSSLNLGENPAVTLLEKEKVAFNHGVTFGPQASQFIRLNFGTSLEIIDEAIERIARASK